MVNRIIHALLEGLFPSHCCLCQWRCPGPLPLCAACRADLPVNTRSCKRCALPLYSTAASLCGPCLHRLPPFDRVVAPWLYGEYLAHILQRWKFKGERQLTPLLADLWLQQVQALPPIDLLVPVPLHWRRQWRRGYNQAELLMRQIQRHWPELAADNRLLQRSRATEPQSGMNARDRSHNLRSAFTVNRPCANLRVAVVDDILTTGATAAEVAKTLKQAGASRVEIWCLARTPSPWN